MRWVRLAGDFGTGEVSVCGTDGVRRTVDVKMAPIESLEELPTIETDDIDEELQEIIDEESVQSPEK